MQYGNSVFGKMGYISWYFLATCLDNIHFSKFPHPDNYSIRYIPSSVRVVSVAIFSNRVVFLLSCPPRPESESHTSNRTSNSDNSIYNRDSVSSHSCTLKSDKQISSSNISEGSLEPSCSASYLLLETNLVRRARENNVPATGPVAANPSRLSKNPNKAEINNAIIDPGTTTKKTKVIAADSFGFSVAH